MARPPRGPAAHRGGRLLLGAAAEPPLLERQRLTLESGRVARELALAPPAVDAARVRCPTLVVGASDDRITPAAVQRKIARKYGSQYLEAAGHGHMWIVEDGGEATFAQALGWMKRAMR